ncbi:CBS domain-containing protein [Streptomyces sp. NPDC006430]|uniref:CBS domain-containing protein n=1 Tax=Streptomyces sp. NPDC006430 TaxID=3154299 RepID=UPI0033A629F0
MVHTRTVGQLMTCEVVTARRDTPFKELTRLLALHRITGLPVVDEDDKVVGVVSRTDLTRRRSVPSRLMPHVSAGALMTAPAVTVHPEQRVAEAARIMERRRIDRLPVVDEEDRLIGITTRRDLLRTFLRTDDEIHSEVAAEVTARLPTPAEGGLRVLVKDGIVTLQGIAPPDTDSTALLRAAWRVDGVVGVVYRPPNEAA